MTSSEAKMAELDEAYAARPTRILVEVERGVPLNVAFVRCMSVAKMDHYQAVTKFTDGLEVERISKMSMSNPVWVVRRSK